MAVLFISEDYLKESSVVDENVDTRYIKRAIIRAQDITLQETIGTDLLNELKDQVENNTLTAANTTLLNSYILPFLTPTAAHEVVITAQIKIRNKGVVKMSSEDAQPVTTNELMMIIDLIKNEAQFHGERLRKYLLDNSTTFPLFLNGNTDLWKIRPIRTAYQSSLFLGRQRKPFNNIGQSSLYNENWYNDNCCYYR